MVLILVAGLAEAVEFNRVATALTLFSAWYETSHADLRKETETWGDARSGT